MRATIPRLEKLTYRSPMKKGIDFANGKLVYFLASKIVTIKKKIIEVIGN